MTTLIEVLGGTALLAVWLGAAAWLWWAARPARRGPSALAMDAARLARREAPPARPGAAGRWPHASPSTARAMAK